MRHHLPLLLIAVHICCFGARAMGQAAIEPVADGRVQANGEWYSVDEEASAAEASSMTPAPMSGATPTAWQSHEAAGYTLGDADCGCQSSGTGGSLFGSTCADCAGTCTIHDDGMRMRRFDLVYFSSDLLFLGRDADNFRILGTDGATQSFDESLSHGFEPGFRVGLGLRLWGNGFVEARHAMSGGWDASGTFQPLSANPAAIAAVGSFDADYLSTEINLVAEDPLHHEYQLLLGLRYLEHGDSFSATLSNSQAPADVENYFGNADNSMFGIQAGFRTGWFYRRSVWSISLIGGVLNNEITQRGPRYTTALLLDGAADPVFSVEDQEVSIFADLEASVAYPIFSSTFVRLGYQGVFMDNAATVTRQAGSPADPSALEFHGGFVGIECYH